MNDQSMILFEQALLLLQPDTPILPNEKCKHENTCCEDGVKKVCLECGQLLEENYMVNMHYFTGLIGMKNRKIAEPTVYNEIPHYIDCKIKEKAVEIYYTVTKNKTFRNTSKKAIILACLHRASALLGNATAISYYDLLIMFNLKQHEANKGFVILSSNIPKTSPFYIKSKDKSKDVEELISINSKMKLVGIDASPQLFRLVANVYRLLKDDKRLDIVNSSQYSSVICGCIYFWSVYMGLNKHEDLFAISSGVSKMTLLKIYTSVCDVVFNFILKELFVELLKNCTKVPIEGSPKFLNIFKKKTVTPETMIYGPEEKCFIYNPFDVQNVKAVIEKKDLPLNEVDETLEWNVLLNGNYYTPTIKFPLMVTLLKKNDKNMYFDFTEYNKHNNVNGNNILYKVLIKTFDKNIEIDNI